MNEHLLRVYTGAAAPADRAASQRVLRQRSEQATAEETPQRVARLSVKPHELKQLLSSEEQEAISAMFTGGRKPQAYGADSEYGQLSGKLIDRVV